MARIQHLAIASQNPEQQAEFYKNVFGWQEIRRLDNPRARGLGFTGPHHFGVYVDDLESTANKCLANGAVAYAELPEEATEVNYRSKRSDKFKGFENGLFDIADEPWIGAPVAK